MMTAEKSFYHYVLYIKDCRAIQTLEKTIIPVMARVGWGEGVKPLWFACQPPGPLYRLISLCSKSPIKRYISGRAGILDSYPRSITLSNIGGGGRYSQV